MTAKFFKAFEESLASILVAVFANIWENKKMSDSQRLAIIILLFKKGDPQLLANYRRISLTNADYKVLAYVMSNCLSLHLTDVIAVNQTASMPGRFIGTNIQFVQDTMDYFAMNSPQSAIIFLDFKKAFNSISHKFLFSLLLHIGCPLNCMEWVRIMYSGVESSVCHNSWLTPSIALQQGVCQGCPLSCHLFNLVGHVLIFYMCDCGLFEWWMYRGDPSSLYTDDTVIFAETMQQIPQILQTIHLVGNFTGLTLNISKTIAYMPSLRTLV